MAGRAFALRGTDEAIRNLAGVGIDSHRVGALQGHRHGQRTPYSVHSSANKHQCAVNASRFNCVPAEPNAPASQNKKKASVTSPNAERAAIRMCQTTQNQERVQIQKFVKRSGLFNESSSTC